MEVARRFHKEDLRAFTRSAFEQCGLGSDDASQAADVLCTADEWGISSHGVARLRSYSEMITGGRIDARAQPRVVRDLPCVAVVDGDNGLGLTVGPLANRMAIAKAKQTGIGVVSVRHSNHFGIAGYYSVQGVSDDLIGCCMTNTPPLVSPFGGRGRRLGTNPISIAFPTLYEPTVLIDMATSAISLGDVENALRSGGKVPPFSIVSETGTMSVDPADLYAGGALLPLGGASGHKGYCLGAVVDLLCGVLSGASWGPYVPPFLNSASASDVDHLGGIGHLFCCVSLNLFDQPLLVRKRIDCWAKAMRDTPPAEGCDTVLVPGDPEYLASVESERYGVSLASPVVRDLLRLRDELRLPLTLTPR